MNRIIVLGISCFAVTAGIGACGKSDAPKTPLGAATPTPAAASEATAPISGEAKLALDSGNALFRAKAYPAALAQYRRSADLAPTELTPLLGIMMVADVTKDSKLAAATLPRIRRLNPSVADSSPAMSHSAIMKAHERVGTGAPPPP